jgi:hypothetical protein
MAFVVVENVDHVEAEHILVLSPSPRISYYLTLAPIFIIHLIQTWAGSGPENEDVPRFFTAVKCVTPASPIFYVR